MLKVTVAERILELVTTASRAGSIAGDLLEDPSHRGSLRFWLSLLRIFAAHIWQDFRIHWPRMIWLIFLGVMEFILLVFWVAGSIFSALSINDMIASQYFVIPAYIWLLASLILSGWHVAQRSDGCELASGIALAGALWIPAAMIYGNNGLFPCSICILVIAGSVLFRFRQNARCRKRQAENH